MKYNPNAMPFWEKTDGPCTEITARQKALADKLLCKEKRADLGRKISDLKKQMVALSAEPTPPTETAAEDKRKELAGLKSCLGRIEEKMWLLDAHISAASGKIEDYRQFPSE